MKLIRTDKKIWVISLFFIALISYLLFKIHVLEAMSSAAMADTNLTIQGEDYIRGSRNAQIIIFEFSDYECPFCERLHPDLKKLTQEYDGKVAWVFKNFPLSSHTHSKEKAEIAQCVGILEGNETFWKFTDAAFAKGSQTPLEEFKTLAQSNGIPDLDLQNCLDSEKMKDKVQDDKELGEQYGISGTPGNVILNTKTGKTTLVPGALPYNSFKTIIDGLLKT
jgi:protein-disulfide isomerase